MAVVTNISYGASQKCLDLFISLEDDYMENGVLFRSTLSDFLSSQSGMKAKGNIKVNLLKSKLFCNSNFL